MSREERKGQPRGCKVKEKRPRGPFLSNMKPIHRTFIFFSLTNGLHVTWGSLSWAISFPLPAVIIRMRKGDYRPWVGSPALKKEEKKSKSCKIGSSVDG
jgi:hypothetical protein